MQRLGNVINPVLKKIFCKNGVLFSEIVIAWPNIVQKDMLGKLYPVKIESSIIDEKKTNTLVVLSKSHCDSFYIQNNAYYIIEKLSNYFGFKIVSKIQVKTLY